MISLITCLALIGAAAGSPVRRATPSLTVSIAVPDTVENVDGLTASATVANTGSETVTINPYGTVLSPFLTPDFIIDGSKASGASAVPDFIGAFAKHVTNVEALKSSNALITLAPGESKTVETSLADRYDFAPSGAGAYTVSVSPKFNILTADGNGFESVEATTIPATVSMGGSLTAKKPALEKRISYASCSSTRQTQLATAASDAQAGSQVARSHLVASGADATYVEWFGAANSARQSTVANHYSLMNGDFQASSMTYDCTCTDSGTYAYVYPDSPNRIYLCGAFWSAPACGVDSKQGTLIHEASHFNVNGGTDDVVYGQSGARNLARTNPASAITNADNHEYYEEALYC